MFYDKDNEIAFYGFGGKLPPNYMHNSQCFAMNGSVTYPFVNGLQQIKEYLFNKL